MSAYRCPRCQQMLTLPESGEKVVCPQCGQKLRAAPAVNRTVLVNPEKDLAAFDRSPLVALPVEPVEATSRRGDREIRPDDEDRHDDRLRRSERRRRYRCPHCDSPERPRLSKEMGQTAWVLLAVGIMFWPLILVALLCCMEEKWRCPECREELERPRRHWEDEDNADDRPRRSRRQDDY